MMVHSSRTASKGNGRISVRRSSIRFRNLPSGTIPAKTIAMNATGAVAGILSSLRQEGAFRGSKRKGSVMYGSIGSHGMSTAVDIIAPILGIAAIAAAIVLFIKFASKKADKTKPLTKFFSFDHLFIEASRSSCMCSQQPR